MSDAQAIIYIQAEMNDRLSGALQRINSQLSNTVRSLNGLKATSQSAVGATNAVGAAISQLSRHSNSLNSSLKGNALSQQALSASFRNSSIQATALSAQLGRLQSAGLNTTPIRAYITQLRAMDSMQKQVGNSMRAMQFQQMGNQLNAFSQRMTNSGTRISMGLTLPLVAFFRMGFQSFRALDKQVIRTTKLMADSFDDKVINKDGLSKGLTDLGYAVKVLGDGLDKITSKWGISRELVQGLAGDFAELGISAPGSLARLTELTVEFEKLGNIDITKAQSTVQAMFQTISRIRTDKGLDVTSKASLDQMTAEIDGAIAFFNFAENKTTLSLSNIAEAFPEVTAAATSFGLNMQTTAAMLVPMIGASFQTGASANSIKVSLQRMIATTKQNADMLKGLSSVLGDEFVPALGLGSGGIMELITNYDLLQKKMGKADQLVFMSKLFGVRQGPRMEVAIAQMNKYSKKLEEAGSQEQLLAEGVEKAVNAELKRSGFKEKDMLQVRNLVDINNLTSAAQDMEKETGKYKEKALAIQRGQETALYNLENKKYALMKNGQAQYYASGKVIVDNSKKQDKQNKLGEEFNKIQTETGKLLTGQMYGKALTEKNKNDELKRVEQSVEVQYGRAREAAKSIARELTSVFGGILEQINPIIERVAKFFRELSDPIKKILGVLLIALALIGPMMRVIGAVGQLGAMFSNARAAGIRKFKGNVVELNQSLMRTSDIALRIGGNFKKFGQDGKIFTSRKDAKRLEKLAPIIAKQDRGEELTAKEKMKGTKYIRQLAGGKAVKEGKALLSQKNFYGLDQTTKDYVRSLDPVMQAQNVVNNLLTEHSKKTAGIFRKAAQKIMKLNPRPASNNTAPIYPTPTGAPIPPQAPIYPTPTGAPIRPRGSAPVSSWAAAVPKDAGSAMAARLMAQFARSDIRRENDKYGVPAVSAKAALPKDNLRDIVTRILATLQAIQACVCNAKAATTGRPSPAASGAPTNAPPFYPTPTGAAIPAVTATGTSAPAGAAATVATTTTAPAGLFSPAFMNMLNMVKAMKPVIPSAPAQSLPANFMNPMGVVNAMKPVIPSAPPVPAQSLPANFMNPMALLNAMKPVTLAASPIPAAIVEATATAQESVATGVRKVKRLINSSATGTTDPIPAAIEAATVSAEETVATNVKAKAKGAGKKKTAKATGPIPAAVDTAVVEAEKVVAETVVADAKKKGGRPKGSTNKPKVSAVPVPDPIAPSSPFGGTGYAGIAQAAIGVNKTVTTMIQGAADSATRASVDFKAVGESIAQVLNLDIAKGSVTLTKDSLVRLFTILGQQVPEKLRVLDTLVDKEGNALNVKLEGLAKLAGAVKIGVSGKALSPTARIGASVTGKKDGNPFYVKGVNEAVSSSVGNAQAKAFTSIRPEDIEATRESIRQMQQFEEERRILKDQIADLAAQSKDIALRIKQLVLDEAAARQVGNLSLATAIKFAITKEKVKLRGAQEAISDLKRNKQSINTELQSVRQSANVAFNMAQEQMASSGKKVFAGTSGKGMPFGSAEARTRARRTGERYMPLVYGEKGSDTYRERKLVARPSYSPATEPQEIKDRRESLSGKRLAGIRDAKKVISQQPEYKLRESKRREQQKADEAFARIQEQDAARRAKIKADRKAGIKTVAEPSPTAAPAKVTLMPKDQFLAGQAENLQRLNTELKTANSNARSAKSLVASLEGEIVELTNSNKRPRGGKKNAIAQLNTELETAKGKAEKAKLAATAAKEEIARINAYDPAKGGLPARTAAPDISASVRPKSLSAGVQSGATTLGNINSQLSATLQIPTAVLDQFYQTLKIQGKGLAEVASNAGLQAADDLALLKQELLKIGLTVEEAIAKPAVALKQLQAAKFEKGGEVQALFQRLVMYARDVADKGVQEAFELTKQRLDAAKARGGGGSTKTAPTAKATPSALFGSGMTRDERKVAVEKIKSQIIAENKSAVDFYNFELKTLQYAAQAFGLSGSGKKAEIVARIHEELKKMEIAVEKAILTEAVVPVTKATAAVVTTSAAGAAASADEVAKVVKAEKDLTVAVEKSVVTAATTVEKAAVAASSGNAYLAALKAKAQSPLAPRTTGGSGAKATDSTPAVPLRNPISAPFVAQIATMNSGMTNDAVVIIDLLQQAKSLTAKQVAELIKMVEQVTRGVRGATVSSEFSRINGGSIAEALKWLDNMVQEKLVKEAEKVKTVTAAVTAVPVTPAPPVAPTRPASSSIPLSPEGSKSSGVVVNPATKVMLDAARAAAETVAAVSSSYKPEIIRESGRIVVDAERNLVRAIEEQLMQTGQLVNRITSDIIATGKPKLDVPVGTAKALIGQMDKDIVAQSKARAEAEKARVKAEMDARIRQNVFESARIRTLTGGAGRFAPPPPPPTMMGRLFDGAKDGVRGIGRRARSSIIGAAMAPSIATPKQLFSGSARMPDSAEITGTIAKIANPVRIGTMLGKAFLSPATAIAKKVSSPSAIQKVNDSIENTINRFNLFFRKPVIKTDLFATRVGTSRQTIKAGLERDDVARGVSPATSRQQRIINKTANRTATNNVSVSRFESLANGMVSKVQAFGVKISGALRTANSVIDPSLGVATLISGQIIKAPVTLAQVYTKAVVAGHKVAFNVISKGLTLLSSQTGSAVANLAASNFAQSTIAGKSILYVAQTLQKGLVGLASGIGNLPTTIGTGLNLTVNAIKNPKASLISAGKGLLSAASTIKDGAGKLTQAAILATAAGTKMAGGAIGRAAMKPVTGVKTMFVGGSTFIPQGQDAAGNNVAVKKGGLFRRSVTQTTDASGVMTEQRGKGMMGRMKGGIGKGLMGGIKGLGTAAGSMSSMMLYQLGPAGMALQGPMNKVITLLTRTKLAFFSVTLPIMLIVGAIFLLKRTFSAYGDKTTGVAENFGKAFKAIMAVVNMLKRAFFDFFASLFGGAESSGEATGNIAKTVSKVADTTAKFAEKFKAFFESTILPAIYSFLSGLSMAIKGIVSFVGNLIKFVVAVVSFFRGGGDKAKEAMGNALKGMLKALVNVLKGLLKMVLPSLKLIILAVTKVVELIVQLFEWLVIGCINLIRYMVTGIINLVFTIIKAYVFIIDKIIELFVLLETTAIKIATEMVIAVIKIFFGIVKGTVAVVKGIISVWAKLPAGIGKGIGMIGELIAGLIRGIGDKVGGLIGIGPRLKKALYGVADGFESAGNAVQGVGEKTTATLESGVDAIFTPVENAIGGIQNKAISLVRGISGALITGISSLNGIGDAVMGVVQGIQNKLLTATNTAANVANAFIGGFSDVIANAGNGIADWLSGLVDGNDIKQGIGDALNEAVTEGAQDPSAANEAGKTIAKAIGEGIKSLKDNFYDKVISNLSDSLGKLKDQITKALEKQKDESLKFFDDQIAAIDALAAADAELTAEKQKQEDERLRIAERALQRDSYLKNRALAIYEGRIDDARTMGLEEAKNQQEFNKETEKNAKDAQAAAKAKNVEAAKKVIENQKQVASNQFDKDLEDFQTFIENIGKNGTLTAAELTTQFNELKARADATSTGMQSAFQGYYNALPGLIARNTTPSVGFFTSSMDALIAGAQAKYGLDSGVTDPTTMLGITNGMMSNLGTVYTNGFSTVVAPAYNDGQELLADIAKEFADPSISNPKSAAGIYASAISNATAAVRAEFMKMKTDASSAFAEVVKGINDELKGLAITKAINDAKEELKNTGGGTDPSGGSATSPATGVTGPTAPTGNGPGTYTEAEFLKAAGKDKVFKLNDTSKFIQAAKAALAFYGFTGFDVGTGKMGEGTVKAIKAFQTKYKVASPSGDLGPKTAEGLGIFNKVGVQKKFMGGIIKREAGGAVPGYTTQGVPAILHGGEYVISSKAVQNLGLGVLSQLNGLKHGVPAFNVPKPQMPSASRLNMSVTSHSTSETTQNYNFYVDNFIGEDQWFESMMKDYNVKVVPNNQKAAGLESRVVRTYNGLNRGM